MRPVDPTPLGGTGKTVEADETYIGKQSDAPKGRFPGGQFKNTVVTLVERGGAARSFHVDGATTSRLSAVLRANVSRDSRLMTDEWRGYGEPGRSFVSHEKVTHSRGEYVRGEAHTNTVEGYYSVFKRGMKGIYQHCGERHLHRYLSEFDFRYSYRVKLGYDDTARAALAVQGAAGKRLTYKQPRSAQT